MRKLSLLLAALTVAFAASAITPILSNGSKPGMKINKARSFVNQKAPRMANVVTEQPEGTLLLLNRGSEGGYIYDNNGRVGIANQSGSVLAVITDDGKTMWIKDIVAGAATGAWVKGDINEDGTILTVELGQSIYHDTYTDEATGGQIEYDVLLGWSNSQIITGDDGSEALEVNLDEQTTKVEFSIEGDVLTMLGSQGATVIDSSDHSCYEATGLGLYYSHNMETLGFINWNTTFTNKGPFEVLPVITEQPEGDLVLYNRSGNSLALVSGWWTYINAREQTGKVEVVYAPDGKTVYIKDIAYGHEFNTWVKGELDEQGLIHIPAGQCIYWSDEYMGGVVLSMGNANASVYDSNFTSAAPLDDEIVFLVDGETLTLQGTSATINGLNYDVTGLTGFWSDDNSMMTSIDWNTTLTEVHISPAVPADPAVISWEDKGSENGNSRFNFTINMVDVDGNPLDADHVYYSIYTDDDQIFTFEASNYSSSGITEDMTEVPYSLQNWDLHPNAGYIFFYRTNAEGYETFFNERIGIQVHYVVDGVKNSSNIVYWYRPIAVPAMPANPEVKDWYDSGSESGFSTFSFTINLKDVDGNPLVKENVYYSIYTDDDQIFTFTAERYGDSGVKEDMTLVPYILQAMDLHPNTGYIYFYRTNAEGYETFFNERIGIQVHYIVDGIDNATDIVYWYLNGTPSAIDEVNDGKSVASVRYYNMAGQEMTQPQGLTIQVTTYTDGSTRTDKVVK